MNLLEGELLIILAGAAFLVLLLGIVLIVRFLSVRSIQDQSRDIPQSEVGLPQTGRPSQAPTFRDLTMQDVEGGFSTQLQTAAHNIRIEQMGERLLYIVDGVSYQRLEDIPDGELQKVARQLQDKTLPSGYVHPGEEEWLRQVKLGNQTTLEARSPDYTISIQSQGRSTRFIVNGLTYDKVTDIPDPDLQRKAKALQDKIV